MLGAFCFLIAVQTGPKDFQELAKQSRAAYASLKGYRDEWTLAGDDGKDAMSVRRRFDGGRRMCETRVQGDLTVVDGSDGKTDYNVMVPMKMYSQGPHRAGEETPSPKVDPGSCSFTIDASGYSFASDPPIPILSVVTGEFKGRQVRHALGRVANSGGTAQVDLLFWPNAWILCDATITTTLTKGEKSVLHWVAKSIETNVKFGPKDFALDPSLIKGFTRLPEGSFGGG